jgi:leader peptidase (prepilin peptidase)/N-methyltransferase
MLPPQLARRRPITWVQAVTLAVLLAVAGPVGWGSARLVRRFALSETAPVWPLILADLLVAFGAGVAAATPAQIAAGAVLGWALVLLAAVDILVLRLPDAVTLPLAAAGVVSGAWMSPPEMTDRLVGAVAGWLVLSALGWAFFRLRGKQGIGQGDAKLLAAAGAWLGWRALPAVVLIACAGGFAWMGVAVLRKGRAAASAPMPFGPPLCAGVWIVWLAHALVPVAAAG